MKQNRIGRGKKLLMAVLVLALLLSAGGPAFAEDAPAAKNGEVIILYTSDIHCGVDEGFGLVGLRQIRQTLEDQGYTTILVDIRRAFRETTISTMAWTSFSPWSMRPIVPLYAATSPRTARGYLSRI